MTKFTYSIPEDDTLWGHTDILDTDLEKLEFSKNFEDEEVYNSILDEQPVYHSLMNFPEEEEDGLSAVNEEDYNEDNEVNNSEENSVEDRNSYQDADKDGIYYFI